MWDKQLNDYVIEELAKVYIEYDKKGKSEKEFKIHNINEIVVDFEYAKKHDFLFSIDIPTMKQISQGNSGRCWIFAGLNFLREYAAKRNNIKEFDFSQIKIQYVIHCFCICRLIGFRHYFPRYESIFFYKAF